MVKFENPNGYIEITNNYFASLVGKAAQSCFGVTGMVDKSPVQSIKSFIKNKAEADNLSRGVSVKSVNGSLTVDLHISVSYGVNISAIADSIKNKVRYTVETATGLKVSKVNVFVDMIN
ncbi:MAG: Asp23/Gls24 family envelope stress response protein [Clostridiales bacterium]|nr:Asp23/Gls24 family envelope stress response protein [Clostridiales bacterium]